MIRRIFNILTVATALFFIVLLILATPSFFDPEFEIVNNSAEAVSVVAVWRNNEKKIGRIPSMSSHRFSVEDEAAMQFRVRYASGRVVETEPLYFTSGIKVIATISSDGVIVRYDHET
jgi:hypothetical protein